MIKEYIKAKYELKVHYIINILTVCNFRRLKMRQV